MANSKYLDYDGLLYFWGKLKTLLGGKQDNLTATQLNAVNSGITADKVTTYDGYATTLGNKASSTHVHGNLTNDGKLANAAPTIASGSSGDYIVITDSSDSNKVGRGIQFSGTAGKFLDASGSWSTPAGTYSLPNATTSAKGGVIVGSNISVNSGTISVADGSTSTKGVVKLNSATNSSSTTEAATASAVKAAYDLANGKQSPATTLAGYGITNAYTKTEIDSKLTSAMHYKGSVATKSALPTSNNVAGDFYNVEEDGANYAWSGSEWDQVGAPVEFPTIPNSDIDTIVAS